MAKRKKKKKKGKKKQTEWSAMDEVRHPIPPKGFAFKDRKRALKDKQDREDMRNY
jgi:hypothetical protein